MADLMGQAFSTKPPESGAPKLRFTGIQEGTPDWTSAHEGAMKLGQGAARAIRNLSTTTSPSLTSRRRLRCTLY